MASLETLQTRLRSWIASQKGHPRLARATILHLPFGISELVQLQTLPDSEPKTCQVIERAKRQQNAVGRDW